MSEFIDLWLKYALSSRSGYPLSHVAEYYRVTCYRKMLTWSKEEESYE